jgi:hypothetical protein
VAEQATKITRFGGTPLTDGKMVQCMPNSINSIPEVHCTIFGDNSGAIETANVLKKRPRTKHLNIKYHHFRTGVKKGTISIYHVGTNDHRWLTSSQSH